MAVGRDRAHLCWGLPSACHCWLPRVHALAPGLLHWLSLCLEMFFPMPHPFAPSSLHSKVTSWRGFSIALYNASSLAPSSCFAVL